MPDPDQTPGDTAPPRTCENCGATLRGGYCHLCGQPEVSPVRHLGHAVEEVFESFWHLDGRIFRTLRRLWAPGRIANEYLAGHRVRYVAPMRLFVILTALTFFVAQFLIPASDTATGAPITAGADISTVVQTMEDAGSVAEVEAIRDRWLAELEEARAQIPSYLPGMDAPIISAHGAVRRAAQARITELGGPSGVEPPAPPPESAQAETEDWGHPEGMQRLGRNVEQLTRDPRGYFRALLGSAPMAMFMTVPLFAVMLKLAYLSRRRLYLEHLVVALYSHAWMMLVLLLYFASVQAGGWLLPRAAWAATPLAWLHGLLLASMPVYLLWMQKRVYAQRWPMTLFKYAVVGVAYLLLLLMTSSFVALYVLLTL